MTKAVQKITLSPSRDIPFDKLVLSQSNVRRIKAGVSVEELAEDIARRGLLQGLNVRPMLDAEGVETGLFEIPAARAGAFVTLDRDGSLAVHPSYVRPEDEPREESAVQDVDSAAGTGQGADAGGSGWTPSATSVGGTIITSGGQPIGADLTDDENDGALRPLPERLVMEVTAHRTLALREAIGRSPDVALTLLLLKLVTDTFRNSSATGSCLEASVRHVYMSAQAPDLKDILLTGEYRWPKRS